ncbi:hypothetical protein C1637_21815 [Chryseobacterium lactis]|uniref:Uncharacterized protein n=1 Tax=Chryseobacterium lactis TaxID=1241981 RepID=A0A3G6RUV1_CHRLC|nr:hypothetical protein [Chryseobacterium lactis]AZA84922.1 hypothetical protein EG342_24775 [Chryseobacterium lactis]AZB05310.1 hypothetical protein EG341_15655 [Chryseobacterium lactis]PNW11459.1 hypothetical protein C1637_21815 [Chryseobacterium lactis]
MKYSLYAALALLSFISCGNNDNTIDDPRPVDKKAYHFEFKNYHVTNTVLYKGTQKSNPDESLLNTYWPLYQEPAWMKINLDLQNNSIQLVAESTTDFTYNFKMSNDSVFINENGSNKPSYIGNFNKNEASFTLKRTFQYIKRVPREDNDGLLITQTTLFGTTKPENIFGKVFKTPSEMTKSEDQVLWSNIEYYYKAL